MRLLPAVACIVSFAACSFEDPKLDTTRFRCDGGKPCPSGQICAGTVCVVASHDGVSCGTGLRCTNDQKCCVDGMNPPRCIPGADSCIGGTNAACDGAEDCPSGTFCCGIGIEYTCAETCAAYVCEQATQDCPTDVPNCCTDPDQMVPWKFCQSGPC